jgi:PEP-CTERM motif
MISMKTCARVASALSIAVAAPASAATFDLSSGGAVSGAIRSYTSTTDATLKLQASGFSFVNSALATATLGTYGEGLGITNSLEGGAPAHTVDNYQATGTAFDFILLVFNKAVNISSATLSPFAVTTTAQDNDAFRSYGNLANAFQNAPVAVSLANVQSIANNASGANVAGQNTNSTGLTALNAPNAYANVWIVGAARSGYNVIDSTADGFKLKGLTVTAQAVPEPATWGMMIGGMGIAGMALRRRRRTAVAQVIA